MNFGIRTLKFPKIVPHFSQNLLSGRLNLGNITTGKIINAILEFELTYLFLTALGMGFGYAFVSLFFFPRLNAVAGVLFSVVLARVAYWYFRTQRWNDKSTALIPSMLLASLISLASISSFTSNEKGWWVINGKAVGSFQTKIALPGKSKIVWVSRDRQLLTRFSAKLLNGTEVRGTAWFNYRPGFRDQGVSSLVETEKFEADVLQRALKNRLALLSKEQVTDVFRVNPIAQNTFLRGEVLKSAYLIHHSGLGISTNGQAFSTLSPQGWDGNIWVTFDN